MIKTTKIALLVGLLISFSTYFSQEITYQKPIEDLDFYSLTTTDKIYRINYGSQGIQISVFSKEMSFLDMIVLYPKDVKFKNSKGRTVTFESLASFESIYISKQYMHILLSPPTGVKGEYAIIDVKVDLPTFTLIEDVDILELIKAKREADVTDGIDLKFSRFNKEDSTVYMFYKKPTKFGEELTYSYSKLRIEDDILVENTEEVALMPGLKRDFFTIDKVFSNTDGALVLSGYKVDSDKFRRSKYMYFIKEPGKSKFEKMDFKLDNADPLDFRIFIEEDAVNIIGLAKSQKDDKYINFMVRYKNGDYKFPEYKYLDKDENKPDYVNDDFQKVLTSVYKYGGQYYLLYHYRKEEKTKSDVVSYYSYLYTNYHIRGFNVEQFSMTLSKEWSTTVKSEYVIDRTGFMDFTKAGLMFHNDNLVLAYNDSYENSEKELGDTLTVLDLKVTKDKPEIIVSKQEQKEKAKAGKKKVVRSAAIEIEDINTEHDFTITLVKIDKATGKPLKMAYQQRRLHSLIFAQEIKETEKGKFFYPYYYQGLFGLCSINLINI